MSTRSFIGKKIGNKVKYFFCHWDGYVDGKTGVGFTLNKYYNDERTVDELFDSVGGHIESLEKTPEETVADLQKLAKEYPRFGEEIEREQQKLANFYTYLRMCVVDDTEWAYLYDDGEWYYTSLEMEGFHSLKDTMTNYGLYAIYEDDDKLNFNPGDYDAARDYCHGLEGRSARVVDTKTGKQMCATIKWFREHDDDMKEHFHRRGRMLRETYDVEAHPHAYIGRTDEYYNEDKKGDVELYVKITDPETFEEVGSDSYVVHDVPESVAKDLEKTGHCEDIFQLLFNEYPEDFPEKDPGVDAEILDFCIDWESFN